MNPSQQRSPINSPPSSHHKLLVSYINSAVQSPQMNLLPNSQIHQSQIIVSSSQSQVIGSSSSSPQYNPARVPGQVKTNKLSKKMKKIPTWTHSFVCLSQVNQSINQYSIRNTNEYHSQCDVVLHNYSKINNFSILEHISHTSLSIHWLCTNLKLPRLGPLSWATIVFSRLVVWRERVRCFDFGFLLSILQLG